MEWLANELATVSDYMTTGCKYALFESIRAFAQALEKCGCDHLEKFEIDDLQTYWSASAAPMKLEKGFSMGSGAPATGISRFSGPP
jgi:hypothetical protein